MQRLGRIPKVSFGGIWACWGQGGVSGSWCCRDKVHQSDGSRGQKLWRQEVCSVSRASNQVGAGLPSSGGSGGESVSWPLPASGGAHIPWLVAPSFIFRESGVLLSLIVAGKESCCQLVPTWIIQLLSQLQTFSFITCRVDSDCSGFIPGLRSFLPEAIPAPGSVHLKGRGSGDSGSFCVNLGAPLSLPQPCG